VLGPYDGDDLRWHPVTKKMSNPAFQGPECAMQVVKPPHNSFFQPRMKGEASEAPKVATTPSMPAKDRESKQEGSSADDAIKAVDGPSVNADEKLNEDTKTPPGSLKSKRKANGHSDVATPPLGKKSRMHFELAPGQKDISAFLVQKKNDSAAN